MLRLKFLLWRLAQHLAGRLTARELVDAHTILTAAANTATSSPWRIFSQGFEDSVLFDLVDKLNLQNGTFIEIGVGNGLETNTSILLARDWSGVWISNQRLKFRRSASETRLGFIKTVVTLENLPSIWPSGHPDVISVDIDSYDAEIARRILDANLSRPKIFIVEYNPNFGPSIDLETPAGLGFWKHSNFYGASISTLKNIFQKHGYVLVAATDTFSANAFFVPAEIVEKYKLSAFDSANLNFSSVHKLPNFLHQMDRKLAEHVSGGGYFQMKMF